MPLIPCTDEDLQICTAATHCSIKVDGSNAENKLHCTMLCICGLSSILFLKKKKNIWLVLLCRRRRHPPYTHSCGSSRAPPTAPCPDRPGRWRCRSSRSGSPPAGSAATRRSWAEDEHTQSLEPHLKIASHHCVCALSPLLALWPLGPLLVGVHRERLSWEWLIRRAHGITRHRHSVHAPDLRL